MYRDIITHRRSLLSTRAKREIRIGFIFQVHLRRTRQVSSSITKINGYTKLFTIAVKRISLLASQFYIHTNIYIILYIYIY